MRTFVVSRMVVDLCKTPRSFLLGGLFAYIPQIMTGHNERKSKSTTVNEFPRRRLLLDHKQPDKSRSKNVAILYHNLQLLLDDTVLLVIHSRTLWPITFNPHVRKPLCPPFSTRKDPVRKRPSQTRRSNCSTNPQSSHFFSTKSKNSPKVKVSGTKRATSCNHARD